MNLLLKHAAWLAAAGLLITACLAGTVDAPAADGPAGRWLTASGALEVALAPCGPAWCGTVVRVLSDRRMSVDDNDADTDTDTAPATTPPLMGLQILHGLESSSPNQWRGKVYNRDNGQTYDAQVTYRPPGQLEVRGYRFLPWFGKTQVWHRVQPKALP